MAELLFSCLLTAILFSLIAWLLTSRYYQRRRELECRGRREP
jgi:hypothetical protein